MSTNNKPNYNSLGNINHLYEKAIRGIEEYINKGKAYKDMTSEEYQNEVNSIHKSIEIYGKAYELNAYSTQKLEEDFDKIRLVLKKLLL
ncbi:hypothetical protein GMD78_07255 [Ornithinibacillus sp. L9]|uniref:Uncharacterized protein n=1 Tax=Ornithinibacillus caprae TaxID=2678566 RepID=A0A6N8FK83_9BACI|nr:hypothetical protein [Ornithinibacillus caprae]MUK88189.1 hypothetical protein [Ornithinibacillus caprae]